VLVRRPKRLDTRTSGITLEVGLIGGRGRRSRPWDREERTMIRWSSSVERLTRDTDVISSKEE